LHDDAAVVPSLLPRRLDHLVGLVDDVDTQVRDTRCSGRPPPDGTDRRSWAENARDLVTTWNVGESIQQFRIEERCRRLPWTQAAVELVQRVSCILSAGSW
jgi:hypothetical protein